MASSIMQRLSYKEKESKGKVDGSDHSKCMHERKDRNDTSTFVIAGGGQKSEK